MFYSSHMQDLKDLTHDVHYENYRTEFIRTHTHKTPDKKLTKRRKLK